MLHPSAHVAIRLAHPDRLYIAGRWIAPAAGGRIDVIAPHTEAVTATVAEAGQADIDAAVAAAREAFDRGPWPRLSPAERAAAVRRLHAELVKRLPEIEKCWTEQVGALATVSPFVTVGSMGLFDYYASMAETFPWTERRVPADGLGDAMILREPVGVVAAIIPWNNPFGILVAKLVPALVAGCTVVMKPAPESPLEAYLIAECAEAAGLPPGVVNLVPAHREASDALVRHPGVDKVNFTGSTAAGQQIAAACGARMARCTLELGGKSAAVVLDDADIGAVGAQLARTITLSAGQICATLSRAIVPASKAGALTDAIAAEMAKIRIGDPYDVTTEMGPLSLERQRARVEGYVRTGVAQGARLVRGGGRPAHLPTGWYVEPTLFADVTPDMQIAQHEIFGPVLVVMAARDEQDAIRLANSTAFGLYGAVFTNDREAALRVIRGVRAGTLSQNVFRFDHTLPFGGYKQSGVGREGGVQALENYVELKSVLLTPPAAA